MLKGKNLTRIKKKGEKKEEEKEEKKKKKDVHAATGSPAVLYCCHLWSTAKRHNGPSAEGSHSMFPQVGPRLCCPSQLINRHPSGPTEQPLVAPGVTRSQPAWHVTSGCATTATHGRPGNYNFGKSQPDTVSKCTVPLGFPSDDELLPRQSLHDKKRIQMPHRDPHGYRQHLSIK